MKNHEKPEDRLRDGPAVARLGERDDGISRKNHVKYNNDWHCRKSMRLQGYDYSRSG